MRAEAERPISDAVIEFAEAHLQPVTDWQRRLIRWAFRGDGRQPLVSGDGYYFGGTTPSRRVGTAINPAQIPQTLMEPAMDAGQPPDLTPMGGPKFVMPGVRVEYASLSADQVGGELDQALNGLAAQGWRLVTFDGERYIFERPARDSELHER